MAYEYLAGIGILFVIWLACFILRRDLRKPMVWSGLFYILILVIYHLLWIFISRYINLGTPIVPNYWEPQTLFGLGSLTHGMAIEDILFMFLVGGIATSIYEIICRKKISVKRTRRMHYVAPIIGAIISFIYMLLVKPNAIYPLILFGFVGALIICIQRKDLITHSLFGGLGFLVAYFIGFSLFNLFFPEFISQAYHLENLSGIVFLGIPLEEYLYAISFGLMWAPLYEYEHGEKDIDANRK